MRAYLVAAVVGVAAFFVLVGSASAQAQSDANGFKFCNAPGYEDLVLVFLNPDLRPAEDGLVHASGTFFIQFQARGEKALEIATLKFSFGKPVRGAEACSTPEWITEAVYLKNYRSDNNWKDGFFIPINTYNVADGEYAAAISVYNEAGVEMVRGWTNAIVENGGRKHSNDGCPATGAAAPPCPDTTKPWPMVLPGDGERLDGKSGLYIEVAEDVSDIKVYVNGRLAQLTNASAPMRDDDLIPDLCPPGPKVIDYGSCEGQIKNRVWGPAWEWDGAINTEDVIVVKITDKWGNYAEKVLHIGDPTIGGRVTGGLPEFDIVIDESTKTTDAQGRAVFDVIYRVTKDFLHGDIHITNAGDPSGKLPPGITVRANPNHVMAGAGEEVKGTITFVAGPASKGGTVDLTLAVSYLAGTERISKEARLKLIVADKANSTGEEVANRFGNEAENIRGQDIGLDNKTQTESKAPEDKGFFGLPAPEPLLVAAAAVGVALLARRRQHG